MENKHTQQVDFSNPNADKITSTSTISIKQETLEEAADQFEFTNGIYGFKEGVKWHAKRSYSYDEVRQIAYNAYCLGQLEEPTEGKFNQWIVEFKK
jgi:hypothetical protein